MPFEQSASEFSPLRATVGTHAELASRAPESIAGIASWGAGASTGDPSDAGGALPSDAGPTSGARVPVPSEGAHAAISVKHPIPIRSSFITTRSVHAIDRKQDECC